MLKIKNIITAFLLLLILFNAFYLRENFLNNAVNHKFKNQPKYLTTFLISDALGYYKTSIENPYPCFSTERPPGFLILTRLAIKNFGYIDAGTLKDLDSQKARITKIQYETKKSKILYNHIVLRYFAIFYNLLAIAAIFVLGLILFNRATGLIAALLWSINVFSISFSYDYFRGDLVSLLNISTFIIFILLLRNRQKWKVLIPATVLGIFVCTLLILTRTSALTTVFFTAISFITIALLLKKLNRKLLISYLAIFIGSLILTAPYFCSNLQKTGTIAPYMNRHAKYWRNNEFAGKEGFPAKSEVRKDLYCGKDISFYNYVFKLHSFPQVIKQYFLGYWTAFTKYLPELQNYMISFWLIPQYYTFIYIPLLCFLAIAGLLFTFYTGLNNKEKLEDNIISEKLLLLIFALISLFPFAFILSLDTTKIYIENSTNPEVDLRFTYPILPFVFLYTAVFIDKFTKFLQQKIKFSLFTF